MEANELRIGNFVYFKHCDYDITQPRIIEQTLKPNLVGLEGISVNRIEYNNIEPIKLTDEWLTNFGFKQKLGNWFIDNFRFHINKPFNYNHFLFCEGYSVISARIVYVHQLQNLYFCLRGQELKLQTHDPQDRIKKP